jgi:hypothetical protein
MALNLAFSRQRLICEAIRSALSMCWSKLMNYAKTYFASKQDLSVSIMQPLRRYCEIRDTL